MQKKAIASRQLVREPASGRSPLLPSGPFRSSHRALFLGAALALAGGSVLSSCDVHREDACLSWAGEGGEFSNGCLGLDLRIDSAPSVSGSPAAVFLSIAPSIASERTQVEIDLPPTLSLSRSPDDSVVLPIEVPFERDLGTRVTSYHALVPGRQITESFEVSARRPGIGAITVRVRSLDRSHIEASRTVWLRVGAGDHPSEIGNMPAWIRDGLAHTTSLPEVEASPPPHPKPEPGEDEACLDGFAQFVTEGGSFAPVSRATVEIWSAWAGKAPTLLATAESADDGYFWGCFHNRDSSHPNEGANPFFRVILRNSSWDVTDKVGNKPYSYTWPVVVCDQCGGNVDPSSAYAQNIENVLTSVGAVMPPNDAVPALGRAITIHNDVEEGYAWVRDKKNATCWDGQCASFEVIWGNKPGDNGAYFSGSSTIVLDDDAWSRKWVVLHEVGHAVMHRMYQSYPDNWLCDPHYFYASSSESCAFTEGFATWFALRVMKSPKLASIGEDADWNFEARSWDDYDAIPLGVGHETVEGPVVGALWDLVDAADEWPWDRTYQASGAANDRVWLTIKSNKPVTYKDFMDAYLLEYANDDDWPRWNALATAFQNTLDLHEFRDPKFGSRPHVPDLLRHAFQFEIPPSDTLWHVIALRSDRPDLGTDHSLDLYDDLGLSTKLIPTEALPLGIEEFVAVHNVTPQPATRTLYPAVEQVLGERGYTISHSTSTLLTPGHVSVLLDAEDNDGLDGLASAWTLSGLTQGKLTGLRAVAHGSGQKVDLFLLDGSGSVSSRSQAAKSSSLPAGKEQGFTFDAPSPGGPSSDHRDGAVVLAREKSGVVDVFLDQTPPTLAAQVHAFVGGFFDVLTVAANDAETGVIRIRFAIGGSPIDTAAWLEFDDTDGWEDGTCYMELSQGFVQPYFCMGSKSLDITNYVSELFPIGKPIPIEVQVMNGAGLISESAITYLSSP